MKNKESLLKKISPKTTTINKTLIVSITGIIAIALLLAITQVFHSPNKKELMNHNASNDTNPTPVAITQLPSYNNPALVSKLLHKPTPVKVAYKIPSSVMAELTSLKNSQDTLMDQISSLKNKLQTHQTPPTPHLSSQAMQSPIFFSGASPRTPTSNTQKTGKNANISVNAKNTPSGKMSGDQEKLNFLSSDATTQSAKAKVVTLKNAKNTLMAGSYLHAVLKTEIDSDLPGNLEAVVTNNVYDSRTGRNLLIPAGTLLLGKYNSQVTYGQNRVQAVFSRLIRPDDTSISLSNPQGVSSNGVAGLSGSVNNHWGRVIGSALLVSLFNVPQAIMEQQQQSQQTSNCHPVEYPPYYICSPSIGSNMSMALAQSATSGFTQVGTKIVSKNTNLKPTITIQPGKLFSIMVQKDIQLPIYKGGEQ